MKILKSVLILFVILNIATCSYAGTTNISPGHKGEGKTKATATDAIADKPGMKVERGVKNILFGWTEIPKSIIQVTRDSKNPIWGITGGTLKGVGKAFPRTVSGVADVVSFPIADYDKMPVRPDELKTQIK